MLPKLPQQELMELCRRMLVIRHFEEAFIDSGAKKEFRGHYHSLALEEFISPSEARIAAAIRLVLRWPQARTRPEETRSRKKAKHDA
jgi:TPP-dependent pyruvate/acetoin dehydrogenase alpha subunit